MNMKRHIYSFAILLVVSMVCLAGTRTGVSQYDPRNGSITLYYEIYTDVNSAGLPQPTDFNDANSLVMPDFRGDLYDIQIDPNGTDTSISIGVYYNPKEPQSVTDINSAGVAVVPSLHNPSDSNQYTVYQWDGLSDLLNYFYPVPVIDPAANIIYGPKVRGDLYIGIKNADHATTDRVRVYLFGKMD
jgi:hypothetical protein